jgi:hypothetical protein
MRKLQKITATLGGIAVASTIAFGVSVASASSAQAACSFGFFFVSCTQDQTGTPHKKWTTEETTTFSLLPPSISRDTTVKNPAGKAPPGQQK